MRSKLEETIAAAMREDELGRRRARAQILTNHARLLEAEASEADKPGVKEALASLQRRQEQEAQEALERAWSKTGYWRRLWRAVRNKPLA